MDKNFPILAIETSGDQCSVAVMLDENVYAESNIMQKHIHSEKLLTMIDDILSSLHLNIMDISRIAYSNGPGSFTGLRIGLAAVKGIVFGSNIPIIPVPTFDVAAYEIAPFIEDNSEFVIVNNVNVDELYFAKYKKKNERETVIVEKLKIILKSEFDEIANEIESIFGDFVHEKVTRCSNIPSALSIAKWAYFFGKDLLTFDIDFIEPNYLKKFIARVNK